MPAGKVPLDNTAFRDARRSCAVSVGFFLPFLAVNQSEASLKLYLTPTPFFFHTTTFVRAKLKKFRRAPRSLMKRPIWSYPLSSRLFGDLLAPFFHFIRFLLRVACVASVSYRVIARKLEPKRGNACYAGYVAGYLISCVVPWECDY